MTATRLGTAEGSFDPNRKSQLRRWVIVPNLPGHLAPVGRETDPAVLTPFKGEIYKRWLQRTLEGPASGVFNANTGQYSVKGQQLKRVPTAIAKHSDYVGVVRQLETDDDLSGRPKKKVQKQQQTSWWNRLSGSSQNPDLDDEKLDSARNYHCNVLEDRKFCHKIKIASPEHHIVSAWKPDERMQPRPSSSFGKPGWVDTILAPVQAQVPGIAGVKFQFIALVDGCARLGGVLEPPVYDGKDKHPPKLLPQVKEVFVWEDPPCVHVFDIVEHGRRFFRRQTFASDCAWSYHAPHESAPGADGRGQPKQRSAQWIPGGDWSFTAGEAGHRRPSGTSLVIQRTIPDDPHGRTQTYVPSRLLLGLFPDALFEDYEFWQNDTIDQGWKFVCCS
eukprot:gene318-biopygen71950